jgi:cell division transport system permease protein
VRLLRYAVDEAAASLWRGRQSAVLAVGTIAVAMFVLGALLVVTGNLQRIAAQWSASAELSVYLRDEVTPGERAAIEQALRGSPALTRVEFISRDEALRRFKDTFAELAGTVDSVGDNPLPASFEGRLDPAQMRAGAIAPFAERVRQMPGVADVRYDQEWLARLLAIVGSIRAAGFVLAAVLIVSAALTVANVVRLALVARRDEIDVMRLVGAPDGYVRGPFLMEGIIQGGAGALVAILTLALVFYTLRGRVLAPLAASLNVDPIRFLPVATWAMLIGGGMLVGCLGGLVASRDTRKSITES